ncbi:MAG: twin-arginine translocase TatA/TatE family subunit [Legionella sp.]|nr:twin-arginine translocase TatA/TatE family subunit [Legionella sp.]
MSGEILLILIVALVVFGPSKLPMLAAHLGLVMRKVSQLKEGIQVYWQNQLNELKLQENLHKAAKADGQYQQLTPPAPNNEPDNK